MKVGQEQEFPGKGTAMRKAGTSLVCSGDTAVCYDWSRYSREGVREAGMGQIIRAF